MYYPIHFSGRLFQLYLKAGNHPAKVRIQNLVGRYLFKNGIALRDKNNVQFKLSANDWITRILLIEAHYEKHSIELAKNIMQQGGTFIDVGANFGLYTCSIAVTSPAVQVIAIEPNYKIIPSLIHNIQLNGAAHRVQVFNTAMANAFGFVTLEQPAADNLGTTKTVQGKTGLLNVSACTLETIFNANNIRQAKLVKIDIEGNEFSVFENFDFNKYTIEHILMEFNHLSQVPLQKLLAFFKEKGFDAFDIFGSALTETSSIDENNIWLKKL